MGLIHVRHCKKKKKSKLEKPAIEVIQNETDKKMNRAFSELWNNFKQLNKQRGKGQKNHFKKLMAKKFSKSDKNYKLIDPKVQQFPSTRKIRKLHQGRP